MIRAIRGRPVTFLALLITLAAIAAYFFAAPEGAEAATTVRCTAYSCPAVMTNNGAWAPQVRPSSLYIGNTGAPYLTGLRWNYYKHGAAHASGTLHAQLRSCLRSHPAYKCKYVTTPVTIALGVPRLKRAVHGMGGGWYYSAMAWTWNRSGLNAARNWTVDRRGYWQ